MAPHAHGRGRQPPTRRHKAAPLRQVFLAWATLTPVGEGKPLGAGAREPEPDLASRLQVEHANPQEIQGVLSSRRKRGRAPCGSLQGPDLFPFRFSCGSSRSVGREPSAVELACSQTEVIELFPGSSRRTLEYLSNMRDKSLNLALHRLAQPSTPYQPPPPCRPSRDRGALASQRPVT